MENILICAKKDVVTEKNDGVKNSKEKKNKCKERAFGGDSNEFGY